MTEILDPEGAHLAALRRLGDFRGRRVLELGCGDGRLTLGIARDVEVLKRRPTPKPGGGVIWEIKVYDDDALLIAGDDGWIWEVPEDLDDCELLKVEAYVTTPGSGSTQVAIRTGAPGAAGSDVLSTKITIESGEYNSKDAATQPVVIAVTGYHTIETEARIIDCGAVRCLAKPIEPGALATIIDAILEQSASTRRRRRPSRV